MKEQTQVRGMTSMAAWGIAIRSWFLHRLLDLIYPRFWVWLSLELDKVDEAMERLKRCKLSLDGPPAPGIPPK